MDCQMGDWFDRWLCFRCTGLEGGKSAGGDLGNPNPTTAVGFKPGLKGCGAQECSPTASSPFACIRQRRPQEADPRILPYCLGSYKWALSLREIMRERERMCVLVKESLIIIGGNFQHFFSCSSLQWKLHKQKRTKNSNISDKYFWAAPVWKIKNKSLAATYPSIMER